MTYLQQLSGLASVFAFLCIIPMPKSCVSLHSVAKSMYLFPVVGAVIGLGVGVLAWGVFEVVEPLLAGLLVSAVLLVVAGLHHTDGLADMADGLMAHGDHKRRLDAMKDKTTGTGGIVSIVFSIAGLIITLSLFATSGVHVLFGIVLAETLAKFSMVVITAVGKPAAESGTGLLFVKTIHADKRKTVISVIITVAIVTMIIFIHGDMTSPWSYGVILVVMITAVAIPVFLACVAKHCFGGITGDVIGATNDIVRVSILVVFVSI